MTTTAALPSLIDATPTPAETRTWLRRVDAVAPLIAAHRDRAERERATPEAVFTALREHGLHRMWVGRAFGGGQVGIGTGSAVLQRLAGLDASVAWQIGVQGAIGRLSDYLPEPVAHRVFAEDGGLAVGSVNPTGRAERVPGGYRLSGTWAFASGSDHADWLVCAATVDDPEPDPGAAQGADQGAAADPATRMLFVPRSAVRIRDTWHTLGLRGTGSNHYDVPGAFVPEEYTVPGEALLRPPPGRPARAYGISYYDFGPFTSASTALGVARAALEAFRREAVGRGRPAGATVQDRLARAEIRVRAARALLADAAAHAAAHGPDGGPALSALIRLTAATVAESCAAAVDAAYSLGGTGALYAGSRLERCFRDIHSVVKHITLSPAHFETAGRYLLGGELRLRP
jgi:alkylation response protein AidB-like acyl-CoA dehydrogenase